MSKIPSHHFRQKDTFLLVLAGKFNTELSCNYTSLYMLVYTCICKCTFQTIFSNESLVHWQGSWGKYLYYYMKIQVFFLSQSLSKHHILEEFRKWSTVTFISLCTFHFSSEWTIKEGLEQRYDNLFLLMTNKPVIEDVIKLTKQHERGRMKAQILAVWSQDLLKILQLT